MIPFFILNFVELNQIQSILIVSLFTFVYPIYSVYFHGQYGATLGKMACKVRVVDVHTEEQISIRQALLRDSIPVVFMTILMIWGYWVQLSDNAIENTAFFLIPSVYFLWFVAEVVTMLTNRRRRAIHDFIAGTVVIRYEWD